MAELYKPNVTRTPWGRLQVIVNDQDVTYFRGVPTQVQSWSFADPFADSTAQINFPQITVFDSLGNGDLSWLQPFANVDIKRVHPDGTTTTTLWEGLIASWDSDGKTLSVSCIGCLYQLDYYVRAPKFDRYARPLDQRIKDQFDSRAAYHLRTAPFIIEFPDGWGDDPDHLDQQGNLVSGFYSRSSGDWGKALTGYVQELLSRMRHDDGRQWTVMKNEGRVPVLRLRETIFLEADWSIYAGAPGININLTQDHGQAPNVLYGTGEEIGGSQWDNSYYAADFNLVNHIPLAHRQDVHPPGGKFFSTDPVRIEEMIQFSQTSLYDAKDEAERILRRDSIPGWVGTINLTSDPVEGSRFDIKAGDRIRLRHLFGSGEEGYIFHIAQCSVSWDGLSVSLTVDTQARDLLNITDAIARNRGQRTPANLLKVGQKSVQVDDTLYKWNYEAGSGYIPFGLKDMPFEAGDTWPWETRTQAHPPKDDPRFYIPVHAAAASADERWTIVSILAAEQEQIRQIEITAYDHLGNVYPCEFHVSIINHDCPSYEDMPTNPATGKHEPFFSGAFDTSDPDTDKHGPDSLIVGWGDNDQKAGYWPGRSSDGDPKTGKLRDTGGFSIATNDEGGAVIAVAIYCEDTAPAGANGYIYFAGRMYRDNESRSVPRSSYFPKVG